MKTIIHLNQVGYITSLTKTATVITNRTDFSVCDKNTAKTVFSGELTQPIEDIASGDITSTADFSEFCTPGEYYLKIGSTKSYTFLISDYPFYDLAQDLLKSFYFNRCGMSLHKKFAGEYKRKKCHLELATLISDANVKIDASGGWHDAGDYGRYTVSAAITLGHLLYAYEFNPESFNEGINIPESGNGIPDILNECRYELNWLLKMQDKDGGVFQKVTTKNYPLVIMPDEDTEELFVYDKTLTAACTFAAATALASRIYQKFDVEFAEQLKIAATTAWIWTLNNPDSLCATHDRVQASEYVQRNANDDIFWAAAELFRLTGEKSFESKLCDIYDRVDTTAFTWNSIAGLGALSYIFSDKSKQPLILDALKTAFIYKADNIVSMSKHSGYGTAKQGNRYLWGSNMDILCFAMILIVANTISPNQEYITTALEQVNYILGKNAMGTCYVTGFGHLSCSNPHHRPCCADEIEKPITGLIAGGPDMLRSDEYSRWLIPKNTPPAKCYIDVQYSYSTNETAIFWNSPAIFVLSHFNRKKYKTDKATDTK